MTNFGKEFVVTCNIKLDTEKNVFNPGEEIKGIIELNTEETVLFYGCKVALEGNILVNFTEGEMLYSHTKTIVDKFIFAAGNGKTKIIISPPNSTYPFRIELPYTTIPGSYKGVHGTITYKLVGYLSSGTRWVRNGEKTLQVNAVLELPRPSVPLNINVLPEFNKRASGLKFVLKCEEGGIVYDGKNIPFTIQLENHYGIIIRDIGVALIQYTTFIAGAKKVIRKVIASTKPSFPAPSVWKGSLRVPLKTRPSQAGLIQIEYLLKVIVMPEGQSPSSNLKGETAITVCSKRILTLRNESKSAYPSIRMARSPISPQSPESLGASQTFPLSPEWTSASPVLPLSPESSMFASPSAVESRCLGFPCK